jgi:ribosomal protein S18 acetylase RimI-like enzyme
VVDWTEEQKTAFLRQQFDAQTKFYDEQFRDSSDFLLILVEGEPQGRLYLDRRKEEFRIIDIALLPEMRGKGIGGKIMRDVIAEADEAGVPVAIHVERNNPAMRLYERLGFQKIEEQGVYFLMERPVAGHAEEA